MPKSQETWNKKELEKKKQQKKKEKEARKEERKANRRTYPSRHNVPTYGGMRHQCPWTVSGQILGKWGCAPALENFDACQLSYKRLSDKDILHSLFGASEIRDNRH